MMGEKYLSIITNFGCHYECPYCIVKNNNIDVPKTTVDGLKDLMYAIKSNDIDIVSLSGGGDPLYKLEEHYAYFCTLLEMLRATKTRLEIHTSYVEHTWLTRYSYRMVYHLRSKEQLVSIRKMYDEIVRVVFVVTDDMKEEDIEDISKYVRSSEDIDELSFRQRVDKDYKVSYRLHDFLTKGHQKDWWYITQNDYNLYYAENKVYQKYSDFRRGIK